MNRILPRMGTARGVSVLLTLLCALFVLTAKVAFAGDDDGVSGMKIKYKMEHLGYPGDGDDWNAPGATGTSTGALEANDSAQADYDVISVGDVLRWFVRLASCPWSLHL